MPKIQWMNLPAALRDHLLDRLAERKITVEDLYQLKLWRGGQAVGARIGTRGAGRRVVQGLRFV